MKADYIKAITQLICESNDMMMLDIIYKLLVKSKEAGETNG